jgi:hypothetical protein
MSDALFPHLAHAMAHSRNTRSCQSLSDAEWLEMGLRRVIDESASGRAFLERQAALHDRLVSVSLWFESIKSQRRLRLLADVAQHIETAVAHDERCIDPLADYTCLSAYDLYCGDGHYHDAAVHDAPIDGTRYATGHFFGLNLRTHALFHLTLADRGPTRKREHDMRALKRLPAADLRRGASRDRKVIWIWDRAGIDAAQWVTWAQDHHVYFISRAKENMCLTPHGALPYDEHDPTNAGVTGFSLVYVGNRALRCVDFTDPETGTTYQFLTTLIDMPPGIIALLYKCRWDIEKVFDETKRKLCEKKAWASAPSAKTTQAHFIAIAHNLLLMVERRVEHDHDLRNDREIKRRRTRRRAACAIASAKGRSMPPIPEHLILRATQRALSFLRWVRNALIADHDWKTLLTRLQGIYARGVG